ncbi:hypothetical protein [Mesorhizobium sp.]|uniref:hypothetical protein n=1 Tax=Mesorhizobium sp. TaxID=1871066 RepID=UPI0012240540|nr:hypothetical protein [Mesorhizobium sp.]TIX28262.1 MAG: hypothetical protein E5V35_02665 [Mesorhizobium sp.]
MTSADSTILRDMARLRKALERRMRIDDRAEELRARQPRRVRDGTLADFDVRGLWRRLRPMLDFDGRGYRALSGEMGVTPSDLSRAGSGQHLSYPKVKAICDWAGLDPNAFYIAPANAGKPRRRPRPTARRQRAFHVSSTETGVSQNA